MKKRTGKTVCIGLAGLLLAQIISLQVLQAEPSAEDEQSGFSVLSQEVEPALTGPGPEAPGETAPAFEAAAVYSPTENAPAAETSIGQVPAAETAAEEGPAAETREADAPVESTPAEEPPTEEEPASKIPASEVADSNLQDMDAPSEEEYIPAYPEDRMAGEGLPVLRNITLGEDSSGAYISYYCETTDVLTLSLTDPSGYQVGNIVTQNPGSTFNTKKYILDIDNSALFNLSQSDLGKTIKFTVTGINSSGISGPVEAAGAVTLTPPSLVMPGSLNYSVLSTAKDMYDVNVVSGISWTNGSCITKRFIEKQNGDSWVPVANDSVLTSSDVGTYRIRIQTCLEDQGVYYYSNTFTVAAPVDLITVENAQIGNLLTAVPKGPDGTVVDVEDCSWYLGDETLVRGTGLTYTPVLQELLEAQTLSLRVTVKDYIGNTYTQYVNLAPLDLSTASLSLGDYKHPRYNGKNQIPEELHVMLGDYEILSSLYTAEPSSEQNSKNTGDAWMMITGEGTFLSGNCLVPYVIDPAETDLNKDAFVTQFDYDKKPHMPVLKDNAAITGALAYEKWEKQNEDGTWSPITDAPAEPGTYRVNVTLTPDDSNYVNTVLEEMVFTIKNEAPKETEPASESKPEPEPEPQPKPEPQETVELEEGAPILNITDTTKKQKQTPYPKETEKPEEPKPAPVTPTANKTVKPKLATDLTVTDTAGNPMSYAVSIIVSKDKEGKETGRIYCITADPEKKADGSIATDESGKAVYRQRILKLSSVMIGRAKNEGCEAIRFMVGDAGVQISLSAFPELGSYLLAIAPLEDTELTENEKAVSEGLSRTGKFCAMKLSGADEDLKKIKESGITVLYRKTEDIPEETGLKFLEEARNEPGSIPVMLEGDSVPVTEDGVRYITGQAGISGIFCLTV